MDINLTRYPQYILAQTEKKAAFAEYNAASLALAKAQAQERNAELASQAFQYVAKGELLKTVGEITDREREIGIAFARYATYGRTDKA